jgi:hypothetical protein
MANYLSISTKSVEQGQGRLPKLRGQINPTKTVSSDTTLYDYESGSVVLMGSNGVDITLPAAAAGLNFTVIQTADYATAVCTIIQAAATEDFYGALYGTSQGESAGTDSDVGVSANTKITFSSASLKGDRVRLVSDGTVWYVEAFAQNTAAITFDN